MYKLLYKDHDCVKIASSSKSGISTYTTERIPVLGSCDLLVVHPNTRSLKEMTFQVVNHEGSVIISCATSLELGLIQLHIELHTRVPDGRRLMYSSADDPNKMQKYQGQVTICSVKKAQKAQFKRSNRPTKKYKRRTKFIWEKTRSVKFQ